MNEVGIEISMHRPKSVDIYLHEYWDYVVTVCDDTNETCPVFPGNVKHLPHIGFEDPSKVKGSEKFIMNEF
jgi:arsenate reductase (thioredoxin)